MRQVIITIILLLFSIFPVLAHDGSEHASDLEMWVAGIGIILIIWACVYTLGWKRLHPDEAVKYDSFGVEFEPDTNEEAIS